MSSWSSTPVATLRTRKANSQTETFSFVGVNSSNEAGTPEEFLDAANRLLQIAGMSATITGMKREIVQEVIS